MIDEMIRSGSYPSIDQLIRKAEVTKRTIERDIEYLRVMYKAPIEYDHKKRGYYYSEPSFFIKSVILTEGELFSLALFDRLLEQYCNTPLEAALRRIFDKIVRSLPDNVTVNPGALSPQINVVSDHQGQIDPNVFEGIFAALKTKRTINFDYRPLQKTTVARRTADPYHAICQRGNWYFIGHCHDTQNVEQREDGSVYVKFTTTQMPEVLRWVLGQRHTVEALAPPELISMVKDEAEKVRGMYGKK